VDRTLLKPDTTRWTEDEADRWCLSLARRHYENFPVASLFIPTGLRPHVAAVYAFARSADDIADEPGMEGSERLDQLDRWLGELQHAVTHHQSTHPVFVSLGRTIRTFDLPPVLFEDLLSAFRQDVGTSRYSTFEDVRDYCRRSANPVGRIMLRLFGHDDPELDVCSDAICTALQLTNFWQDFSQDLRRGRIYIPQEDAERFGFSHDGSGFKENERAFRELIAFEVARTRELYMDGKPLLNLVKSSFSLHLRLTWHGGMRVLDKIERTGYNVLHTRPRLVGIDAAVIGYRALRKK